MGLCVPPLAENPYGKIIICTSASRPTGINLYPGAQIYETDTLRQMFWDGTAWVIMSEPVQVWNPTTYTQSGSKTMTTTRGWSQRNRGSFTAQARITNFQAGVANNVITMPTPFTLPNLYDIGGSFSWTDLGTAIYAGTIVPASTTTFGFSTDGVNNSFGITPLFAPAAGDVLHLTIHGLYA